MKAKIVIASTLKPVSEPRAYEKFAKSLAKSGEHQIHIIGPPPTTTKVSHNILLQPINTNSNNIISRALLPWQILKRINKINPDILIVCTHELLFIGLILKMIKKIKLVYDVQENYYFNFLYQNNYPWGIRHILGIYVRIKEVLSANFIDHFILAEQCYSTELPFLKSRFTIVENKFIAPETSFEKHVQKVTTYLLSGTISKDFGVLAAIAFIRQLPTNENQLIIIGHCPKKATIKMLEQITKAEQNIILELSSTPIPHQTILSKIGDKTIALLPYISNKSTENKIPTKLYEFIGLRVPVLISINILWSKLVEKYQAGMSIDFYQPLKFNDYSNSFSSYNTSHDTDIKDIMWLNEEIKLLKLINSLT